MTCAWQKLHANRAFRVERAANTVYTILVTRDPDGAFTDDHLQAGPRRKPAAAAKPTPAPVNKLAPAKPANCKAATQRQGQRKSKTVRDSFNMPNTTTRADRLVKAALAALKSRKRAVARRPESAFPACRLLRSVGRWTRSRRPSEKEGVSRGAGPGEAPSRKPGSRSADHHKIKAPGGFRSHFRPGEPLRY